MTERMTFRRSKEEDLRKQKTEDNLLVSQDLKEKGMVSVATGTEESVLLEISAGFPMRRFHSASLIEAAENLIVITFIQKQIQPQLPHHHHPPPPPLF